MAGWLFADLMLVLFVVGLGTQPTEYAAPALSAATPAPTPAPTPTPIPTPSRPPALAKEPVVLEVVVDFNALLGSGDVGLRDQVLAKLAENGLSEDRAGMVLIFSNNENPGEGVAKSESVAATLPTIDAKFFSDATMRPFWGGRGDQSVVTLEIFVIK